MRKRTKKRRTAAELTKLSAKDFLRSPAVSCVYEEGETFQTPLRARLPIALVNTTSSSTSTIQLGTPQVPLCSLLLTEACAPSLLQAFDCVADSNNKHCDVEETQGSQFLEAHGRGKRKRFPTYKVRQPTPEEQSTPSFSIDEVILSPAADFDRAGNVDPITINQEEPPLSNFAEGQQPSTALNSDPADSIGSTHHIRGSHTATQNEENHYRTAEQNYQTVIGINARKLGLEMDQPASNISNSVKNRVARLANKFKDLKPAQWDSLPPVPTAQEMENIDQTPQQVYWRRPPNNKTVKKHYTLQSKLAMGIRRFEIGEVCYEASRCDWCTAVELWNSWDIKPANMQRKIWIRTGVTGLIERSCFWTTKPANEHKIKEISVCKDCYSTILKPLPQGSARESSRLQSDEEGKTEDIRENSPDIRVNQVQNDTKGKFPSEQQPQGPAVQDSIHFVHHQPAFGVPNNFYAPPVPEPLADLSLAEEMLIARISVFMNLASIKGGSRVLKGHCACISQDVYQLASVLPHLPSEINFLTFQRCAPSAPESIQVFRVRRDVVERALRFLVRYSPAYKGVTIDESRLYQLPEDSNLQNLTLATLLQQPNPRSEKDPPTKDLKTSLSTTNTESQLVSPSQFTICSSNAQDCNSSRHTVNNHKSILSINKESSDLVSQRQDSSCVQHLNDCNVPDDMSSRVFVGRSEESDTQVSSFKVQVESSSSEQKNSGSSQAKSSSPSRIQCTPDTNGKFGSAMCSDQQSSGTESQLPRSSSVSHLNSMHSSDDTKRRMSVSGLRETTSNSHEEDSETKPSETQLSTSENDHEDTVVGANSEEGEIDGLDVDLGPAPCQNPDFDALGGIQFFGQTTFNTEKDEPDVVRQLFSQLFEGSEIPERSIVVRPQMGSALLDYRTEPFFFACLFPTLFVPDLTAPLHLTLPNYAGTEYCELPSDWETARGRKNSVSMVEFIHCLLEAPDGRFARHPTFKFYMANLKLRTQALTQTNFYIKQKPEEAQMTVEEFREQVSMDDFNTGSKIVRRLGGIPGTSPYLWLKRDQLKGVAEHLMVNDKSLMAAFHSGSFAEYHCKPFHDLLDKYMILTQGFSFRDHPEGPERDQALFTAVSENQHVAAWFFSQRTRRWFEEVIDKTLGFSRYFYRIEFAASRGQAHFHSILFAPPDYEPHKILRSVASALTTDEAIRLEDEAAIEAAAFFQSNLGLCANVPTNFPEPSQNDCKAALRRMHFESLDVQSDSIALIHRCMIHQCSDYCRKHKTYTYMWPGKRAIQFKAEDKPCRMGFGLNDTQTARPLTTRPGYVTRNGKWKLDMPRNHPRIVQTSLPLLLGWRANIDFQPLEATVQDETIPTVEEQVIKFQLNEKQKSELERVRDSRTYLDMDLNCHDTVEYVISYCCKQEVSPLEVNKLIAEVVNTANDTSSVRSVACKISMQVLKKRVIPGPEACFVLLSLPLTIFSKSLFTRFIFTGGDLREIRDDIAEKPVDSTAGKANVMDLFFQREDPAICLHEFIMAKYPREIPVYRSFATTMTWPLKPSFCHGVLLRFKRNVRSPDEWPQNDEDKINHFKEFLTHNDCPAWIKRRYSLLERRARLKEEALRKKMLSKRSNNVDDEDNDSNSPSNPFRDDFGDSMHDQHSETINAARLDLDSDVMDFEDVDMDVEEDIEWTKGTTNQFNVKAMNEDVWNDLWRDFNTASHRLREFPDVAEVFHNDEQRFTISLVMAHLIFRSDPTAQILKDVMCDLSRAELAKHLRLIVHGQAGTGKSFVINCLKTLSKLFSGCDDATLVSCPTGTAAFNAGGVTIHSAFKIKMNTHTLPTGQAATILHQSFANLQMLIIDELSMLGARLLDKTEKHTTAFVDSAKHASTSSSCFGSLPVVILMGDHLQLPPVLDTGLSDNSNSTEKIENESQMSKARGLMIYNQFQLAIELTQPVRQQEADQESYRRELDKLRNGTCDEVSHSFWAQRAIHNLSVEEQNRFNASSTIYAFAKKDAVRDMNTEYIKAFRNRIVFNSLSMGPHTETEKPSKKANATNIGMAGAISSRQVFAPGCLVRLMLNLQSPHGPTHGLYNGAMGTVVDFLFEDSKGPLCEGTAEKKIPYVVLVRFHVYTGPAMFSHDPKLVPIFRAELRCERFCCSRLGIPLVLCRARTVHSLQGVTVKRENTIQCLIVDVSEPSNEKLWPNLTYTALSRNCSVNDLALSRTIDLETVKGLGRTNIAKEQRETIQRIRLNAEVTKANFIELTTKQAFVQLLHHVCSVGAAREPELSERNRSKLLQFKSNDQSYGSHSVQAPSEIRLPTEHVLPPTEIQTLTEATRPLPANQGPQPQTRVLMKRQAEQPLDSIRKHTVPLRALKLKKSSSPHSNSLGGSLPNKQLQSIRNLVHTLGPIQSLTKTQFSSDEESAYRSLRRIFQKLSKTSENLHLTLWEEKRFSQAPLDNGMSYCFAGDLRCKDILRLMGSFAQGYISEVLMNLCLGLLEWFGKKRSNSFSWNWLPVVPTDANGSYSDKHFLTVANRVANAFGREKQNLLQCDMLFLPICYSSHWTLLIVRPRHGDAFLLNSMNSISVPVDIILTVLDLALSKDKPFFNSNRLDSDDEVHFFRGLPVHFLQVPQQVRTDCGVCVLLFVSILVEKNELASIQIDTLGKQYFSIRSTNLFRKRIVLELMKILGRPYSTLT